MSEKLYSNRDIINQGNYYSRHVSAMNAEELHYKSDIAAELAHRDIEIDALRQQLTTAQAEIEALRGRVAELGSREDAMCDLAYANGAKQGFSLGQLSDNAGLEQIVAPRYSNGIAELKRLRTQSDQLDAGKAGGGDA